MRLTLRIALPILVLALGWFGMHHFFSPVEDDPSARPRRTERPVQKAEVAPLQRQNYQITIQTQGLTTAHNETRLTPRIAGRIQSVHPDFEPGAFFKRGDILIELDPTDTESDIISAEAQVARSEAALAQEEARATQAELNWKDLGYTDEPNDLVLRIPQLREAEANLKTAQARLAEARRNKLYTKVVAPFDGCVRERLVGPGQSVSPNSPLGTIFATDYVEVRLPISPRDLPFTPFKNDATLNNLPALIRDGLTDNPEGADTWNAYLVRTEGVIDQSSLELFLIARIPDPYGLKTGKTPLRVGQPVTAEVPGNLLHNVYVIPRSTLREPFETVLVDNETLRIERHTLNPYWSDATNLVVNHSLPDNHSIVTSRLAYAANGSLIEITPTPEVEAAQTIPNDSPDA
ncbi:MAG: efflux RND transporter periplasmic adaptor subunit [Verrucomicrobiota bacterium]